MPGQIAISEETVMAKKAWRPRIEGRPLFNAEPNVLDRHDPMDTEVRDTDESTAPLQGTHDVSDADSLEDVIADAYRPEDWPEKDDDKR
jgi:hypothetical protein